MTTGRPSFLIPPKLTGFDVYRQDPYAGIVVELYRDFATQVLDTEEIRLQLDAYVDDRDLTRAEADDIGQMVLGGLPVPPVDGESLPDALFIPDGLIGGITEWIVSQSHRRQPEMALMMALALVGTAAARKVKTSANTHPNLFQIITSPSGGGKDGPRQSAFELMARAGGDELIGTESVTSATAVVSQLSVNPALLFPIDEVGKVVSGIKSKNASNPEREIETLLLKLWSSANTQRFRHKGFAKLEDNVEIVKPNVGIFGTSVFGSLFGQGGLDKTSIVDGFLSRCVIYDTGAKIPPTSYPVPSEPPASIVDPLAAWIDFKPAGEMGWELDPQEKIAIFDAEAERAFRAATVRWDILGDRLPEEHGASIYRRCSEKARKYALVYAISEHKPDDDMVIQRKHADWGIAAISHLTDRFLWTVKHKVAASAREQQMARILEFIDSKKANGASMSDISNKFRDIPRKDRQEFVVELIESDRIVGETSGSVGRPKGTLYSRTHAPRNTSSSNTEVAV